MTAKASSFASIFKGAAYMTISSLYLIGFSHILILACREAYEIRLFAIKEYGRVIHEFDPYFNYRAAEYLWQHGTKKFFEWFDHMSWYPLGRPVGTTIYPGMQFTSVWIKQFLLPDWSINDICCFVPAWFGVLATLSTAALCFVTVQSVSNRREETKSILADIPGLSAITRVVIVPALKAGVDLEQKILGTNFGMATLKNPPALESSIFTAMMMSIVPAHLLRSVGGGYDNESVATTAMQLTFFGWAMTLSATSPTHATLLGILTGFFYLYMVAAWGGYVFVINLIGVHALMVLLLRKLPWENLYKAYTSFYVVGTILAMQVPVVGLTPIKSLEQLGPFGVFAGFQILQLMVFMERKYSNVNKWKLRIGVLLAGVAVALPVVYYLYSLGYFGPISSRVRGLFVKHTKTGNPLVDSVAEHQAASREAYQQYLGVVSNLAPIGFVIVALIACTASSSFLLVYGVAAYFFSHKMVRLILLTAPIASICGGIALGYGWAWAMSAIFGEARPSFDSLLGDADEEYDSPEPVESNEAKKDKKKKKKLVKKPEDDEKARKVEEQKSRGENILFRVLRLAVSVWFINQMIPQANDFKFMAYQIAQQMSHPTIITKAQNRHTGEEVLIDDYREAYFWLRDNTPEDARIMAWWDYGYQITGIANRTTIADGNTWNHEHIALLGRILTSPEKEAHRIARHLADYVLVWAGGGGDDLAKSPHLLRIANSVYRGLCKEPTCRSFGMHSNGEPSAQLEASLLYKLHSHRLKPGVEADRNRFRETFRSKYGKVRIFKILSVSKESKAWVEENRVCDAPGSWFCPGQYPPALKKILKEKKDFAQLEDFNTQKKDEEYQKQYFENLNKKDRGGSKKVKEGSPVKFKKVPWDEIEMINEDWEDNERTSMLWELISQGQARELFSLLQEYPELAHIRSEDGRGPMWWAHEYKRPRMVEVLKQLGVSEDRKDEKGIKPTDISNL